MGEQEFRACSPHMVMALRSAWMERQRREDYRAGVIAFLLAEQHRDRKRRQLPYSPGDFFLSLAPKAARLDGTDQQRALADKVMRIFGSRARTKDD